MSTLLHELRRVTPVRPLDPTEVLQVAEVQAARLLRALQITDPPVPEEVISELPRIQVERLP